MSKLKSILGWVGIVLLGLAHGVLEDLMFMNVLVEFMPPSVDLTGDLFFVFTVPLAQFLLFAITGTFAWFVLRLYELPRLITFWACWMVSRAGFLVMFQNPPGDIAIYLVWITFWCMLVGFFARSRNRAQTT